MSTKAVEIFGAKPWPDTRMRLGEYLDAARDQNRDRLEHQKYGDPFLSPLFVFTRFARAHPALKDATAAKALERVEAWLSGKRYENVDEAWMGEFHSNHLLSADDARTEFLDLWERVKFPAGYSPLDAASEKAQNQALRLPNRPALGYAKFVSLAAHLQILRREQPILLPCREVAKLLGCLPNTVTRYRQWAVRDGFLTIVSKHNLAGHAATEFRFDLRRLPPGWPRN